VSTSKENPFLREAFPLCTIKSVQYIMHRQYTTYIKTRYSTFLILSKNFHILLRYNVKEMRSHWVLVLQYLNFCS